MARSVWPTREAWIHTANVGNREFLVQNASSREDVTIDRIYTHPKDTVKQVTPTEEQLLSNDRSPYELSTERKVFQLRNPVNVSGL